MSGCGIFSCFITLSIPYKLEVRCKDLITFRLNTFGKNTFRAIHKLHTVSYQEAPTVNYPPFNNSEFDHLIKDLRAIFTLIPSHVYCIVSQVKEASSLCQHLPGISG